MNEARSSELDTLFSPRSIAVVGASGDPSSLSGRPLQILHQHHYEGRIYPVNPRHRQIAGVRAYQSIEDVPEQVDLAVIAVRAAMVPGLLKECAAAGARNAVVFSSGFAEESPAGAVAEAGLREIAASCGMRILGPNAEGFFNLHAGTPVSFSPTVDYERGLTRLIPGNVAVISQSGGLGFALFNWAQGVGLGISHVVSTGNETDLEALEVADYLLDDPRTDVVAMVIEGFRHPERFDRLADRARSAAKTLVVAKIGTSPSGRRAAAAHTAHDAGDDAAYSRSFDQAGVIQVRDQEELLDVCFARSRHIPLSGNKVGILTVSGGAGVWLADACEAVGLEVPTLGADLQGELRPLMPSYGSPLNPVDATAQIVSRKGLAVVLEIMSRSEEIDAIVVAASLAGPQMLEREEEALREVLISTDKPVLIYTYTLPGEASIDAMSRLDLAWYPSPVRAARATRSLLTAAPQRWAVTALPAASRGNRTRDRRR